LGEIGKRKSEASNVVSDRLGLLLAAFGMKNGATEETMKNVGVFIFFLAVAAVGSLNAEEPYLPPVSIGKLREVQVKGSVVILDAERASIRVNFVSDSVIRIFMDPNRKFLDRPSAKAIFEGTKFQTIFPVTIEETKPQLVLKSNRLKLTIRKSDPPGLLFEGSDGRLLTSILKPLLTGRIHADYNRVRFAIAPEEQFYGLGERYHSFNHRGKEITLHNVDVINQPKDYNYFSIPFFMSNRGYGIFYNNTWETRFRFGSEPADELSMESPGPNCDFFLIYGPTPREILTGYMGLTGYPPLLPRYALGLWLGDFPYETQDRIPRIGQEFINYQLPWDNFYLDYEWANTFFDYKFSPKTTPRPEELGAWFREKNRQLALIETPFINAECPLYEEALGKKFFCDPLSTWWHTPTAAGQIDFSNPEASQWWWDLHEPAMGTGVSFFVTDDGEFTRDKAVTADGATGPELHNYYSLLYARGMFEEMEKFSNLRGFICSRSGFAGSQKYGSFFAGDQDTDYANLQKVTRAELSSGLSGMPLLRTDLAGLFGELDPGRYMRFIESQALHPMLMLFTYIPSEESSNTYHGKLDRRPWTYGQQTIETFRAYMQLRSKLVPYLYTLAAEAHWSGVPMMRPLFFDYPDDPKCWGIEDEYLVGRDLLVAPVMTRDTFRRQVYFPTGSDWVDFWSDRVYPGGQTISYDAPIQVLPLFARRDSVMPMQDPLITLRDHPYPDLTWRVYAPSQSGHFILYEDDGLTQDYKRGKAIRTEVATAASKTCEIGITLSGTPNEALQNRLQTFEIHLVRKKPGSVAVGSQNVPVEPWGEVPRRVDKPWALWKADQKVLFVGSPPLPDNKLSICVQ
jgi:alpha-glucosidase (family GH31 glycosyl hydrolase)